MLVKFHHDNNFYSLTLSEKGLISLLDEDASKYLLMFSGIKIDRKTSIEFNNKKYDYLNIEEYQSKYLGYVSPNLIDENESIIDNIELVASVNKIHLDSSLIYQYLQKVGLNIEHNNVSKFINIKIKDLTNLERIKISILISLIKNPKVLIINKLKKELSNNDLAILVNVLKELSKEILVITPDFKNDECYDNRFYIKDVALMIDPIDEKKEKKKNKFKCNLKDHLSLLFKTYKSKNKLLISLILISSFIFGVFLTTFSMSTADLNSITLDRLYEDNISTAMITKYKHTAEPTSSVIDIIGYPFSEEELSRIYEFNNSKELKIRRIHQIIQLLPDMVDEFSKQYLSNLYTLEVSNEALLGLNKVSENSKLPTSFNEIAISDYLGYTLLNYEYFENCVSIGDLINKELNGYAISGIYSTPNDDYKTYAGHRNLGFTSDEVLHLANSFSLDKCIFVANGFISNYYKDEKQYSYLVKLSQDKSKDLNFINSFNHGSEFIKLKSQYENSFGLIGIMQQRVIYRNIIRFFSQPNIMIWTILTLILIATFIFNLIFSRILNKKLYFKLNILRKNGLSRGDMHISLYLSTIIISLFVFVLSIIFSVLFSLFFNIFMEVDFLIITGIGVLLNFVIILLSLILDDLRYIKRINRS